MENLQKKELRQKISSPKGITLIALIITVILMLILASVALSAIGVGGLFDKTQNAADLYKDKARDEKTLLESMINMVERYNGGENVPGGSEPEVPASEMVIKSFSMSIGNSDSSDELVFDLNANVIATNTEISRCEVYINDVLVDTYSTTDMASKTDVTFSKQPKIGYDRNISEYICYIVVYDTNGNDIDSNKITLSEPTVSDLVKSGEIQVGDWINYPVGKGTTENGQYTITTSQTGAANDQTYNVTNYTGGWRVLYVDQETGEIELVSADNILAGDTSTTLEFYKNNDSGDFNTSTAFIAAHNNYVGTLNTMCGYYVNPDYASRGRSIGSNPENPAGNVSEYFDWDSEGSNGDDWVLNIDFNIFLDTDHYWETDYNALGEEMRNIGSEYWLASRYVSEYKCGGRAVDDTGVYVAPPPADTYERPDWDTGDFIFIFPFGREHSVSSKRSFGVRACIKLLPTVTINTEDTTKDGDSQNTAWELR